MGAWLVYTFDKLWEYEQLSYEQRKACDEEFEQWLDERRKKEKGVCGLMAKHMYREFFLIQNLVTPAEKDFDLWSKARGIMQGTR